MNEIRLTHLENTLLDRDPYIVYYKNKPVSRLNQRLAIRQGCEDNIPLINQLHVNKLDLYEQIKSSTNVNLHHFAESLTEIEFQLQDAWNFPRDINFHRFWMTPRCKCPELDNEDSYPTGYYYRNANCPLHGVPLK